MPRYTDAAMPLRSGSSDQHRMRLMQPSPRRSGNSELQKTIELYWKESAVHCMVDWTWLGLSRARRAADLAHPPCESCIALQNIPCRAFAISPKRIIAKRDPKQRGGWEDNVWYFSCCWRWWWWWWWWFWCCGRWCWGWWCWGWWCWGCWGAGGWCEDDDVEDDEVEEDDVRMMMLGMMRMRMVMLSQCWGRWGWGC